jgi:hypothetical protein
MAGSGGGRRGDGADLAGPDGAATHAFFTGDAPSEAGTRFTCPDCGGGIYEVAEGGLARLRCSVGHAYSPESFTAEHGRELERALSTASRTLDDRAVLLERMAVRAKGNGQPRSAAGFEREAHAAREHALVIRQSMQRFDDSVLVIAEREDRAPPRGNVLTARCPQPPFRRLLSTRSWST